MSVAEVSFIKPQVSASGPLTADIMIVGEAPGVNEVRTGLPFVGESGKELDRMLHEAGILRTECFLTNVCRVRPPGNKIDKFYLKNTKALRIPGPQISEGIECLMEEIATVKPKVIIALGDTALWALTGEQGIVKWRGSQLRKTFQSHTCTVVPTYHPAAILRMWSWRFAGVIDLRRAARELTSPTKIPEYSFLIRPSFEAAVGALASVPSGLASLDIETRGGHIACVGIGTSRLDAFCIPFMCIERHSGYWSFEEELAIVMKFREVLSRPDIQWTLQNGLYDIQYLARFWGVVPKVTMDTMLEHHTNFAGLPKGLDFLSSIYCQYHCYWKDEGKTWDKSTGEDQLWEYNCKDCVTTWETADELKAHTKTLKLVEQAKFQSQRQIPAVFTMMHRGVRCDLSHKDDLILQLDKAKSEREQWINTALGYRNPLTGDWVPHTLNIRSPKQMKELFFDELQVKEIRNRKTGRPTTNDEALNTIAKRQPLLSPFIRRIQEVRSLGVFLSTFARMPLDRDGRIRCSFNIAGTETFRYSSSENAFGSGTNLQNIPKGNEDATSGSHILPNIRKIFIPDAGYEIFAADLDRADAQVVAWEANDELLKQQFREGADVHLENAKIIFSNERLTSDSRERQLAKAGVHATNYGATARTLAIALGITVREAEHFQRQWFRAHDGIREWHQRIESQLASTRMVVNKFGYRRYYFDRVEGLLPAALAWIPQSTVAIVICRGLVNIHENLTKPMDIQPLLQVHDELVGQYPIHMRNPCLRAIREAMLIEIPYDEPLTIPVGFKISQSSWGEVRDYECV